MTPKKTPIEQGVVDRVSGRDTTGVRPNVLQRAIRNAVRWALPEEIVNTWQGPGQVQVPVAQEEAGRLWDFPTTYNATARPRSTEAISFEAMRALADSYDLMRLVIERRKDQMEKLKFKFVTEDVGDDEDKDARVKKLREFFQKPDRVHGWGPWLRMVVEEMLVIDALTVYPRRTNGGELYALDVMDGATIKVITDNQGRIPIAPLPAFQQFIKGAPMAFYTADELIYSPRNPRANKFYGFSPVEQVIMTVNIALRRQIHQLNYYTEGNVPEGFVPVPETWTPKQVREFQKIWDSEMIGNDGAKRRVKFIPNVKSVIWTREPTLKDQMDEWLGRIICFAFSYPPSALTAQVNRATAETAQEVGEDEGLAPLMLTIKNLIDDVILRYFGWDDIKFVWDEDRTLDPKTQAEVDAMDAESGVRTMDEIRRARGLQPYNIPGMTDVPAFMRGPTPKEQADAEREEQRLARNAEGNAPPPGKAGAAGDAKKGGSGSQAAAGGGAPKQEDEEDDEDEPPRVSKAVGQDGRVADEDYARQDRELVKRAEDELAAVLAAALRDAADAVMEAYASEFGKLAKAKSSPALIEWIDALLIELKGAAKVLKRTLGIVAEDGAAHALAEVEVDTDAVLKLANKRARKYAEKRALELIAKSAGGGKLSEATRDMIRAYIADAVERGATNEEVEKYLRESYAFSQKRARAIARTELRAADVAGNLAGYAESGVVLGKRWLLSNEEHVCPVCEGNADQGVVKLEDEFNSGDMGPPAHPNCRCDIAPVTEE